MTLDPTTAVLLARRKHPDLPARAPRGRHAAPARPRGVEVAQARGGDRRQRRPRGRGRAGQEHRAGQRRRPGSWPPCRWRSSRRTSRWRAPASVLGPEEAETLHVRVPTQGNREITTGLQWHSADSAVATVEPNGVVQARAPGRTEIVMTGFGQERRARLTVHRLPQVLVVTPKPPAEATPDPAPCDPAVQRRGPGGGFHAHSRGAHRLGAGRYDAAGFDRAAGTLTARDTGATTLTARLRGFEPVVWRLQVIAGGARPRPAPASASAWASASRSRRSLLDEAGKVIAPATGVEWTTDRPEVAAVSDGEVRAVSPGHAVVTATPPVGQASHRRRLRDGRSAGGFESERRVRDLPAPARQPRHPAAGADRRRRQRAGSALARPHADRVQLEPRPAVTTSTSWTPTAATPRRLTADAGSEGEPVWTPDGSPHRLHRHARGRHAPADEHPRRTARDARPLTVSTGGNRAPDVSPDGRRVAFVSTRDGNPEIYEAGIDGGDAAAAHQDLATARAARATSPTAI